MYVNHIILDVTSVETREWHWCHPWFIPFCDIMTEWGINSTWECQVQNPKEYSPFLLPVGQPCWDNCAWCRMWWCPCMCRTFSNNRHIPLSYSYLTPNRLEVSANNISCRLWNFQSSLLVLIASTYYYVNLLKMF